MLFSRETRRKLSALRRRPREAAAGQTDARPLQAPEALPEVTRERLKARIAEPQEQPLAQPASGPTIPVAQLAGAPVPVDVLFPGSDIESEVGVCYVMRPEVESVCEWGRKVGEALAELAGREVAFLDIETGGLSAMPVFLVGMLTCGGGGLRLTQILARDYPEEAPLLEETVRALRRTSVLFTYNGATFDLPYLRERSIYHGVDWTVDAEHIDLLKPARRRFRGTLPDCKLQTLEAHLCGREREDDIPGAEIPARYQEFVRTQDGRLLESIIRHNQLDLLTLAELVPHCLGAEGP